jgi:hypothetical protein
MKEREFGIVVSPLMNDAGVIFISRRIPDQYSQFKNMRIGCKSGQNLRIFGKAPCNNLK